MKGITLGVVAAIVIVLVSLAVAIYFLFTNYENVSEVFFRMFDRLGEGF